MLTIIELINIVVILERNAIKKVIVPMTRNHALLIQNLLLNILGNY